MARRPPAPSYRPAELSIEQIQRGYSATGTADIVDAAKNVVMMDLALLSAEIANGMYRKPIDVIAKEFRYDPLPDEIRTVIIAAWTRGGLLPRAAIENMVPTKSEVKTSHTLLGTSSA